MIFPNNTSLCQKNQKIIVSYENNRTHRGINLKQDLVFHYQIDGDVVPKNSSSQRCDFLLENETKHTIYLIELKGTDVEHAIDQIEATINLLRRYFLNYTIFIRIVYRSNTHAVHSTKVLKFKKKYAGRCRIETNSIEEYI